MVSRTDARGVNDEWEGFEKQHSRLRFSATDGNLGSGQTVFEQFHSIDPAGGLDRDELAELVSMVVKVRLQTYANEDETHRARFEREITSEPESKYLDDDQAVSEDDVDNVSGADRDIWEEEVDPDILDFYAINSFSDDRTTEGSSAFSEPHQFKVNFRDWYGKGPVYDRHDTIYWHLQEFMNGAPANLRLDESVLMVWDIYPEE